MFGQFCTMFTDKHLNLYNYIYLQSYELNCHKQITHIHYRKHDYTHTYMSQISNILKYKSKRSACY